MISVPGQERTSAGGDWLPLEKLADVEITSEESTHPIEAALVPGKGPGWRAGATGPQSIRLCFGKPVTLRRVWLAFEEAERRRTQEFVLRWLPAGEETWREIVRQQFNFSPTGATREVEEYRVELSPVAAIELAITPDVSGGDARASLQEFRIA